MLPWLLAAVVGAGGPEGTLTIRSGALEATMGAKNAWTVMTLRYEGTPVTIDAGGQGAIIAPAGGDWIGGAMTAGGEEQVQSLTIAVDGEQMQAAPAQILRGEEIVVTKTSTLASVRQTAVTRFQPGMMVAEHRLTFTQDVDLRSLYPFIYSFSPEFTHWLAGGQAGNETSGEFTGQGERPVNDLVAWFALFNAQAGVGVVGYYQRPVGGATTLWDAAPYRKLLVQPASGPISAGTVVGGSLILKGFKAAADTWQETVHEEVTLLRQRFPAEPAPERTNLLYDEGVPEQGFLTVRTEHLRAVFEAASAWTLDGIWYDGFKLAGPTGHYGTVLVPVDGQFIGTGHTEGGREIVHSLRLTVDGEERPVEVGITIQADEVEVVKRSTIHKFDATHTVTVLGDEIVQRAQLTATQAHQLRLMYLFMHCIEPGTTRWIALTPEGELVEGEFNSDTSFELSRKARWVAQWFPEQELAVLLYATRIPQPDTAAVRLWDQPHYHKFDFQTNTAPWAFAPGDELDFTLVLRVVPGESGDWSAVQAAAADLMERYPPVEAQ